MLKAFGEKKPLYVWADDPRCKVSYSALRLRLKKGWPAEEAIQTPPNKGMRDGRTTLLKAFGEKKPMYAWAEDPRCKASYRLLMARMAAGWEHERAIATPPDPQSKEAFGESKSLLEWSKDERCAVSYDSLKARVRRGQFDTLEEAITTPASTSLLSIDGDERTVRQWSLDPRCTVTAQTIHNRLGAGWSPEDAVFKGPHEGDRKRVNTKRYEAFGESKSLREWAADERYEQKYEALRRRMLSGWSMEDALTAPPFSRNPAIYGRHWEE